MDPVVDEVSGRRSAVAGAILDDVAGGGHDVVVRDGAALLVRRGDVVVRVRADTPAEVAVAERELALAARLRSDGVPVVAVAGEARLRHVDGFVASCWRWVDAVASAGPEDLGDLVGQLRRRTAAGGSDGLPAFDPLAHITSIVGECGDEPGACFVRERVERLGEPYTVAAVDDPLGQAVVHGDLHADNVVVGADGPQLLDLELGGWGPASYDIAPAAIAVRRYGGSDAGLQRFLVAAAADPRAWPGFAVMTEVYELWATAWAVAVAHRRSDWAAEAEVRVETLRDGVDRIWRLS